MRRWLIRLAVMAVLVAAVVVLRLTLFAPQPVQVTVVQAERGRVESTVTNTKAGTVTARRRGRLSPETGGRVVAIPHREGTLVEAGDVLLRLDDASQRAQVVLAQRQLRAVEAEREAACLTAEQADREFQRNRALADQQLISVDVLDRLESAARAATATCQAAAAMIESARAAIQVAKANLDKTILHAPFNGVIAELTVELGEWITPSPPGIPIPSVIDLIDMSSVYISAPMDEVDSARIHAGQPAKVTIDPFPDQVFPGRVVRVAPYVLDIEAQNRTVEIEVELEVNGVARTLLPGTSSDVEVILEVREDVLRIPTPTLLAGTAVMVIEEAVLVRRPVEVGVRNWDYIEIISGLAAGEEIVSSLDRAEVQVGAEVEIVPDGSL